MTLPGRPGEFRPESPTDPDVTLSSHPARATPSKPAGFRQDKEFLRLPVDSILTWMTCPLPSRPGEFHPEALTDSGREPLDSSGSCHRMKATAFRPDQSVPPVSG